MQPIILTDPAVEHIRQHISQTPDAVGFRLSVKQRGCTGWAYVPEIVTQTYVDDVCIYAQDVSVFIDPNALQYIQGMTVDFVKENLGQEKLIFNNPNVASECGCGESFNVSEE